MNPKKVEKKTLVGLTNDAVAALERRKSDTGKNQTEIINDLLTGRDRFRPAVEEFISSEMARRKLSRDETIEELLREVISIHPDGGSSRK